MLINNLKTTLQIIYLWESHCFSYGWMSTDKVNVDAAEFYVYAKEHQQKSRTSFLATDYLNMNDFKNISIERLKPDLVAQLLNDKNIFFEFNHDYHTDPTAFGLESYKLAKLLLHEFIKIKFVESMQNGKIFIIDTRNMNAYEVAENVKKIILSEM
jgi:hypothetical protein